MMRHSKIADSAPAAGLLKRADDRGDAPARVDRLEVCRILNISLTAWTVWERDGYVTIPSSTRPPDGGIGRPVKMYALADVLRLRDELLKRVLPYPDPERPGCYRVPLSSYKEPRREAIISAESLPLVEGRMWNWHERSDDREIEVILSTIKGPQTALKKIILGLKGKQHCICHANGDPLDCRLENLVVKTNNERSYGNAKMGSVNGRKYSSEFKGVSWDASRGKWKAQIVRQGVHRCIGRYYEEIEAAQAYDDAARELFGEFAALNFPYGEGERSMRAAA